MATPLDNIDRELARLAASLIHARSVYDFGSILLLWIGINQLLDDRFALRSASV